MNKSYIVTFSLSVIILFSVAAVLLMIVLPDHVGVLDGNTENYDSIVKSKYTFDSTKNITTDITKKDYIVTGDQMTSYQQNYLYIPGNSDPFTPKADSNEKQDTDTTSNNTSSKSSNSTSTVTTTTTTTTTSSADEAKQKTTNSNGGKENPQSSGK